MKRRLLGLIRKEFTQLLRDKTVLFLIVYIFLEVAICALALTLDVRNMPTAVYDGDRSAESRTLIDAFAKLESFRLAQRVNSPSVIDALMDRGQVKLALVIPADFSRDLKAGKSTEVQLLVDGSNAAIAGQALANAQGLLREHNRQIAVARVERSGHSAHSFLPRVRNMVRIWYNPSLKYLYYILPSMLAIDVLALGMLLPAASIVREKEAGTLEQLMVTPITEVELVTAKILPTILFGMIGLAQGVAMSLWVFALPLRGSLLVFLAISLIMYLSSIGIGVWVGTIAQNMQQALLLVFFIFFPMAFLSGTMVPVSNMSPFMQRVATLSPLRYYMEATVGIFLKGVGPEALWPQTVALTVQALILLGSGTMRLRKSLA